MSRARKVSNTFTVICSQLAATSARATSSNSQNNNPPHFSYGHSMAQICYFAVPWEFYELPEMPYPKHIREQYKHKQTPPAAAIQEYLQVSKVCRSCVHANIF